MAALKFGEMPFNTSFLITTTSSSVVDNLISTVSADHHTPAQQTPILPNCERTHGTR